jgi:hypothetical protein
VLRSLTCARLVVAQSQYGYGLQVGAFCNGKALLIGCKTGDAVHLALLSLHYLDEYAIPEVKIATVSWARSGAADLAGSPEAYTLQQGNERSDERLELSESLFVLRHFSPYDGEKALLAAVLEAVRTPTGTMQEVFHLHTTADGATLLRFDTPDDIVLREGVSRTHTNLPPEQGPPKLDTSAREYLSVLYRLPRMRITLRGSLVVHRSLAAGLWQPVNAQPYTPRGSNVTVRMRLGVAVEVDEGAIGAGASSAVVDACARLSRRSGVALYWQNRLIRYCEPLGMQRSHNELGAGVCGEADVEDLLTPVPHKQAFEHEEHYMRLLKELGERVNAYINNLVTTGVVDPDLQRRRLTDVATRALAAVRAQQALDKAVAADPRRALQCADCHKHRFVGDIVSDEAFEALDAAAAWRCSMHPDGAAAAAGCGAPQEAPQVADTRIGTEEPLPDWLTAYGPASAGWSVRRVPRTAAHNNLPYYFIYFTPAGDRVRSCCEVRFLLEGGKPHEYSMRLTADAAPVVARVRSRKEKRGAGPSASARRKAAASDEDDEDDEDQEEPAPRKRTRTLTPVQELEVVRKEKAKANAEIAKEKHEMRQEHARKEAALAKKELAFARAKATHDKQMQEGARRSARNIAPQAAAGPPMPLAPNARYFCCPLTVAECAGRLTVTCDECNREFHAECVELDHDVAAGLHIACLDHGDAAKDARKQRKLLKPHPRDARRGAGGAAPAPSASGSLFQLFPGVGDAAGDEAGSSDGLPANWPRSAGSPAFLTHSVYGAWPSPEAWGLLHATHEQKPLPGLEIRVLPKTHTVAKAAKGASGSQPRGLFVKTGFAQGAVLGEYVGHVRHATSMDHATQYVYELGSVAVAGGRKVLVDAGPCGNETRFINWHRGLGKPNCEFRETRLLRGNGSCAELVVQVVSTRRIVADEELLIDYGEKYMLPGDKEEDDDDEDA